MADDTEARLSAALHAYAELVDEPGAEALPLPAASNRRETALRRWRGPALVAAAAAVVTAGAWWAVGGDRPGEDPVAGASAASAAAEPAPETAAGDAAESGLAPHGTAAGVPGRLPAALEVGVPYALDLYTHCGVFGTDVGGTWFAVDPPLVEGADNPPAGWGDPEQPGTLTLRTPQQAVFTDDRGHEVVLRAAPDSARPAPCD
jgi:hypothetical protein